MSGPREVFGRRLHPLGGDLGQYAVGDDREADGPTRTKSEADARSYRSWVRSKRASGLKVNTTTLPSAPLTHCTEGVKRCFETKPATRATFLSDRRSSCRSDGSGVGSRPVKSSGKHSGICNPCRSAALMGGWPFAANKPDFSARRIAKSIEHRTLHRSLRRADGVFSRHNFGPPRSASRSCTEWLGLTLIHLRITVCLFPAASLTD
jgi:hypothetical protein